MRIWHIRGGKPLTGTVRIQGAKNAVLPILAATILTDCSVELLNCPRLKDVAASIDILRYLGCRVQWEEDVIEVDSGGLSVSHIPRELMEEMRSSVIFLGALLGRMGEATLSLPGGCELGPRPIDLHLEALRAMGAEIQEDGQEIHCWTRGLHGADIDLAIPSVGATENIMLAACTAAGETVIRNAAREPEIIELQSFLQELGADIMGAGTSTVTVRGFQPVRVVGHRVMPDRIAAATFLCSAAIAGGDVTLAGVRPEHFETVSAVLEEMGCAIRRRQNSVQIVSEGGLRAARPVITRPYPGFPTDAQPLVMAAALYARGNTTFVENIFENRYRHCRELLRMGAHIRVKGRVAIVSGGTFLRGAAMQATDLRGGAAMILAGLGALGETIVYDTGHIERGYEFFQEKLGSLGADIVLEA